LIELLSSFSGKIYYRNHYKGDEIMFNNRNKYNNGAFWGTVIGTSIGIIVSNRISPMNRKKVMRSARKMGSNLVDGMNNLWR
jgi:hypothetical protein